MLGLAGGFPFGEVIGFEMVVIRLGLVDENVAAGVHAVRGRVLG